jgi:phage tail-like protein
MVTSTARIVDPFAAFKFTVQIDGILEAAFTECSGLEISTDVFEYQEGGLNEFIHKLPGRIKLSNITLKRGFATSNELYKWYLEMVEKLLRGEPVIRKKVTITLKNSANKNKSMNWTLQDAFPVKWVGPNFKVDDTSVAIESIEFAHHGITLG